MSFFKSVRDKFDSGGIGLKLELPNSFLWSSGELTATVTITGHKSEPRRINGLRFKLIDDEKTSDSNNSSNQGSSVQHTFDWRDDEPIELAAGQVERFEVVIPLPAPPTKEEFAEQAFGREASGFLEKAFAMAARGVSPENVDRFLVTVMAPVAGANRTKKANRHIRQGRGLKIGIGPVQFKK